MTGPGIVGRTYNSSEFRSVRRHTSRGCARLSWQRVADTVRTPRERLTATVTRTSVPPLTSCNSQKGETVRFCMRAAGPKIRPHFVIPTGLIWRQAPLIPETEIKKPRPAPPSFYLKRTSFPSSNFYTRTKIMFYFKAI